MINGRTVDFPGSKGPTVEQRAAQKRSDRAERISRLRETLRENQWLGPADQITVAQAVNDLLVSIEKERGIRKAKILEAAGIANKNKRDYAIPRDLPSEEIERLSRRLKKRTEPYKKIVEAAARVVPDLDEGDLLLDVFGQANVRLTRGHGPDDGFEELAFRLRFVADRISAKYDLTTFFREVERACVSPAPTPECVQRDAENNGLVWEEIAIEFSRPDRQSLDFDGATFGSFLGLPIELNQFTWPSFSEQAGDLLPYPSVVLGGWTLGSPFPVSMIDDPVRKTRGRLAVVLRFCIAPIGKDRVATPVLRVDMSASIEADWVSLVPGTTTLSNYKIDFERVPKLPSPFTSSDIVRHLSLKGEPRILFLPINGTVCKEWLGFEISQNQYWVEGDWSLRDRALGEPLCQCAPASFSEYGGDTLAGLVDAALCDPTAGLDLLLEQQVKRLKDAFEASLAAARDLRDQNWEIVKKRWAQTGDDTSGNAREGGHSRTSSEKPEANGEEEV